VDDLPLEVEGRFLALKLGMEVRRSMEVEEHAIPKKVEMIGTP